MNTDKQITSPVKPILLAAVVVAAFLAGSYIPMDRLCDSNPSAPPDVNNAPGAGSGAATASNEDIKGILTVPYIASARVKSKETPKVYNNAAMSWDGLNLYNSRDKNKALLVDMDGNEVYSWSSDAFDTWHHMELAPNGDLYVIEKNVCVARLDKDSNVVWKYSTHAHHDLALDDGGNVYALSRRYRDIPYFSTSVKTVDDFILVLSPEGGKVREISVLKMVVNSDYFYLLPVVNRLKLDNPIDLMHTNSIELFDGSLEKISPLFRKGNALLSMRNIGLVCIADLDKEKIEWVWGPGNIRMQHNPSLLDNGNIMVFDNGLRNSRAIELDPFKMQIEWEFGSDKGESFFSMLGGGAQRLPNGNTLITNYDAGTAIEVTPTNDIVWRFVNPDVTESEPEVFERGKIYRMTRYSKDELEFIRQAANGR